MMVLAAVAVWAALFGPSFGAERYRIDPEHVSVNFSMQHSKWAKYQGTIRSIVGAIVFDRENISASSVQVEMLAASVDTLDKTRDAELQAYGFLQGSEFPKITFESTTVEKTGDRTGRIIGDLTMAGVKKPVALHVVFDGEGKSGWDGLMRVGFSATGSVNTNDFGMTGLAALDIGPELDFTIEVEGTRQ